MTRRWPLVVALLLATLGLTAAPALAAPEAPELTVKPIFASIATFNGTLSPGALVPAEGTYKFLYRASKTECTGAGGKETAPGLALGGAPEPLPPEQVKGLTPATEYTVCLSITNLSAETAKSPPHTFKTTAPAKPEPPEATEVSERKATTATLVGVVNPKAEGEPGHYRFLYAQSASVCTGGSETPEEPASGLTSGASPQPVSAAISTLEPGKPYTFCVKAINALGESTLSTPRTFETAIPPETPEKVELLEANASTLKVKGVLNPNAKGEAGTFEFLYKRSSTECAGEGSVGGSSTGAQGQVAEALATGLLPHTTYALCLRAKNAAGEESAPSSPPAAFTTLAAPPHVTESNVSNVASTSATFAAQVNPEGAPTTYTFEYAPAGGTFTPVPEPEGAGNLPEGTSPVSVSVHVQSGLQADTAYQFRVTASNSVQTEKGATVSFTTQPATTASALPDNRAWELVSPPNKRGGFLAALSAEGPIQAAEDGSKITYGDQVPPEPEPQGNGGLGQGFQQLRSVRGRGGGWLTRDIAGPHDGPALTNTGLSEYLVFSPDLSTALLDPLGEDNTLLSTQASEPTPYIRRESLCETPVTAAECYLPVLTGKEPYADVPPGTEFGKHASEGNPYLDGGVFEGASSDLSRVVLRSDVQLTKTPTPPEGQEVYEWVAGAPAAESLQLVSLLPTGEGSKPAKGSVGVGAEEEQVVSGARYAVSSAGSRVFWSSQPEEGGFALYMRDTAKGETLRLDAQQPGAPSGESAGAIFQAASADGSRVYFTDSQRLTERSGSAPRPTGRNREDGDLYECRIVEEAGHLKCELTDLTPESGGHAAEVQNILSGVSEDGSYVYFVANGVLGDAGAHGATQGECFDATDTASSATCNLYEYHAGAITFIATLGAEDEHDWGGNELLFHDISLLTAQASRDGRFLAFMSSRSLTGYDSRDAVSGKPDQEVYLYDAGSGRLVCASCNPTGARPAGIEVGEFNEGKHRANIAAVLSIAGGQNFTKESWVAANLPYSQLGQAGQASVYQQRYLTNDGRLFLNTSDALVPQDVNGNEDAYEFEPAGVGSCGSSSVTFVASSGGCVSLISAGTSGEESGFLDASAVGPGGEEAEDVFFLTASRLSPLDTDTAYDVYDAHTCSGAAPCFVASEAPPACSGEASCRPAPTPQPQIFGAPASATFSGPGNLIPGPALQGTPPPAAQPKTAAQLRAEKLTRALKACKKKYPHSKKRRAACEKAARKAYGAKASAKRASRKGQR